MARAVSVLGSTGSIGIQTLEVAESLGIGVVALSANRNADVLYGQILRFRPSVVSLADEVSAVRLRGMLGTRFPGTEVLCGREGNLAVAAAAGADMTVAAMVGVEGLEPVYAAIRAGRDIALANKETLVAGGGMIMKAAAEAGVGIYPVDSEHSAIWQCLPDHYEGTVRRLLLTASGGPFRGRTIESLEHVTPGEALRHPTWSMGARITVDSATLMNKGLEVIEANRLFGIPEDRIEVVVHPQSIIHSMVEFIDGSVLAQMGFPDMKLPIRVALARKGRAGEVSRAFDPVAAGPLTFEKPDTGTFRCLELAYDALRAGGSMPAVMNSADEKSVELFLRGSIGFTAIPDYIEAAMEAHGRDGIVREPDCGAIMELHRWAGDFIERRRGEQNG